MTYNRLEPSIKMLRGKGFFIWQIEKCAPDAKTLVARAQQAGLGHVLIKIADGVQPFPLPSDDPTGAKEALTKQSIEALKAAGIGVWGWSFVYGSNPNPQEQARRFVQRMQYFGLEGACINAEHMPNNQWTRENAQWFMDALINALASAGIGNPELALSSYRLISSQPDFPFDVFLQYCQIAMPPVYWIAPNGGDPMRSLQESFNEYHTRYPTKNFVPTGAAYGEMQTIGGSSYYWEARPDQITQFFNQAAALDFPAVNFWSWQHAWEKRTLWDAVAAYPFQQELKPLSATLIPTKPNDASVTTRPPGTPAPATGLADTPDDDGVAIIEVGAPGYQEGIYQGSGAQLVSFFRNNMRCTWVKAEPQRSTAYAQWVPRITKSGEYLIEAWIPGINATARRARYQITGVVGQDSTILVELNQLNYTDEWARLGIFELDGNRPFSGMVSLSNLVGPEANPDTQISFSAMRWRRIERAGIMKGYADGFDSPVGTAEERATDKIYPGQWVDANPYLNYYFLGYHTGNDLNLPRDMDKGAPCYSIADGEVIFSGPALNRDGSRSGFGNLIVIKHDPYLAPDGRIIVAYSRYGHMTDLVVQKGQHVRRGDHLATIWNVGTQAYHLHFDISLSGVLETNPLHWPGERRQEVEKHYVDPGEFIRMHRPLAR